MLFSRAASVTLERRANAGQQWGNTDPPPPGYAGGGSPTGIAVTESTALQIGAVYGSVALIADACATLPLEQFSSSNPATKKLLPAGPLLTDPYSEISVEDWIVQYVTSMALRGNFFGRIVERDAELYPLQIQPVHPDDMIVRRRYADKRIEYRIRGKVVPTDDIFHLRWISTAGSVVGINPIENLRIMLGLARAEEMYGSAYFGNSALPGGVIEVEDDLDADETLAMAREWKNAHGGLNRQHLPAILTGGATFRPISITPQDSQFLESRAMSQANISGLIYRIPPHMIGQTDKTTSWGTGIDIQEMGFVTNTLRPYLWRLEKALTRIGRQDGRVVKFNLSERLRGDILKRYQAAGIGLAGGFLCPDDVRGSEDMPPLPDGLGQTYMVPINSQTIKQAVQETMTPATPPPSGDTGGGGKANG